MEPNEPTHCTGSNHPARAELRSLVGRGVSSDSKRVQYQTSHLAELPTSQQAAVLVLFGVLDAEPARVPAPAGAVSDDLDVLIVVRADTLRKHAGQPAFPGGKVDPEDYDAARELNVPVSFVAALREAEEETGLDPAGVEVLGELESVPLSVTNFQVSPVIGWWCRQSEVAVQDQNESSLVVRVPVADLLNPENRHTAQVRREDFVHKSPAFTVRQGGNEFVIWGFTGIVLDRIFTALGWTVPWDDNDKRPAPGTAGA